MTSTVHPLWPSAAVQGALDKANAAGGFRGLSSAVAVAGNPAELAHVVLGFRGWRPALCAARSGKPAAIWRDMGLLAQACAFLARDEAAWLDPVPAEPAAETPATEELQAALADGVDLTSARVAIQEAIQASFDRVNAQGEAATRLHLNFVPQNWALIVEAIGSEDGGLGQALKTAGFECSPFEALERNLEALERSLPTPTCAGASPASSRVTPDLLTIVRLRRLWAVLCSRLRQALERLAHDDAEPSGDGTTGADVAVQSAWAGFAQLVESANRVAFDALWWPAAPGPVLLDWPMSRASSQTGEGSSARLTAAMSVFLSFAPIPAALSAALVETALDADFYGLEVDWAVARDEFEAMLLASLAGDARSGATVDAALSAKGSVPSVVALAICRSLAGVAGLQMSAFPPALIERLAGLMDGFRGYGDDWLEQPVPRWWFDAYQRRIRESRRLPTTLSANRHGRRFGYGVMSGELIPDDVEISALWCLWHMLTRSRDYLVVDPDEFYREGWPQCIRLLMQQGFVSTALALFECWLLVATLSDAHAEPTVDEHGMFDFSCLPAWTDLLSLIRELEAAVGAGRLDPVLGFCAGYLQAVGSGRSYQALQFEALTSKGAVPAAERLEPVVRLVTSSGQDSRRLADRLQEAVARYDEMPPPIKRKLVAVERLRDTARGDHGTFEVSDRGWCLELGVMVEDVFKDVFREPFEKRSPSLAESFLRAGNNGQPLEWKRHLTLGTALQVARGATDQLQRTLPNVNFQAIRDLKDPLNKLRDIRNAAAHEADIKPVDADDLRSLIHRHLAALLVALGRMPSAASR